MRKERGHHACKNRFLYPHLEKCDSIFSLVSLFDRLCFCSWSANDRRSNRGGKAVSDKYRTLQKVIDFLPICLLTLPQLFYRWLFVPEFFDEASHALIFNLLSIINELLSN
jgi:hypothetical protein